MDQQEYEGLIHRLEAQAENDPKRFRAQVFLISNCAYIALALILLFVLRYFIGRISGSKLATVAQQYSLAL